MNERKSSAEVATIVAKLMAELPERMNCRVHAVNIESGINLYKYKNGVTLPLTSTFLTFCTNRQLDPGWVLFLASEIMKNRLKETQALEILASCPGHQLAVNSAYHIILKEIMGQP